MLPAHLGDLGFKAPSDCAQGVAVECSSMVAACGKVAAAECGNEARHGVARRRGAVRSGAVSRHDVEWRGDEARRVERWGG